MKTPRNGHSPRPNPEHPEPQKRPDPMTTTTEPQHPPRRFLRFPAAGLLTSGLLLLTLALPAKADDPIPNLDFPKDANVSLGATVTFLASASTTNGPLTFQWQHSGTNLDGATSSSLRLTSVTELHAGAYQTVISNADGNSATSRVAQLTVDPTFIKITSGRLVQDVEPSESST